jgi:hypothetical protein
MHLRRRLHPLDRRLHTRVGLRACGTAFLEQDERFALPVNRDSSEPPIRRNRREIQSFRKLLGFGHRLTVTLQKKSILNLGKLHGP